jgi:protein-S-isoprenylcysteine O-methyltransferase Ste14
MWSPASLAAIVVGYIAVALGFVIMFFVVKENTFASATIEVSKDQKVISRGLYAIVRHPMYTGGVLIILGTPLALGSLSGVVVAVVGIIWIIWRLLDEEAFLSANLPGYDEYRHKVRYRLVPYIW